MNYRFNGIDDLPDSFKIATFELSPVTFFISEIEPLIDDSYGLEEQVLYPVNLKRKEVIE